MIGVLCEFDGARVLGKARDLADSFGERVVAIHSGIVNPSEDESSSEEKLIHLGADEILRCTNTRTAYDWSDALSLLIKSENGGMSLLLGASGLLTDSIFGRVYALSSERISSFATGLDLLNENEGFKKLRTWNLTLRHEHGGEPRGKTAIYSLKRAALPDSFEDTSRHGRTSEFRSEGPKEKKSQNRVSPSVAEINGESYRDSSGSLYILSGGFFGEPQKLVDTMLGEISVNYGAKIVRDIQKQEQIYGNCFAVFHETNQWNTRSEFHGELLALVGSDDTPLASVADTIFVSEEVTEVLREVLELAH